MVPVINESHASASQSPDPVRFYRRRQSLSTGLLIFIVAVGLPILSVPPLRHRLLTRVMTLKAAMAGVIKPVTLDVGANPQPVPPEFESVPPELHAPVLPPLSNVFTAKPQPAPTARAANPPRVLKMQKVLPPAEKTEAPPQQAEKETAPPAETQLKYQKGKSEQEAYDLLLKSNATVAGMVQGSNPSVKFKSWDAANRGEDVFWVRLTFQEEGNAAAEYIWQVKLQSNEVTPLNFNARGLQ